MPQLTKEQFLSGKKFRYSRSTWDRVTYAYEPFTANQTWSNGSIVMIDGMNRVFHACVHSITDDKLHVYLNVISKSVDVIIDLSELDIVDEKEAVNE